MRYAIMILISSLNFRDQFTHRYKRIVSLDSWMEQLLIPYCLNDLLVGFSGSLKTNVAMSDVLNSQATFQLDTLMTARLEASLQYRPYPIQELLQRIKLSLAAGYTEHQTRAGSEDMNEILRRKLREHYPLVVQSCECVFSVALGLLLYAMSIIFNIE